MMNTCSTESRLDDLEKAVAGIMWSLDARIAKCLDDKIGPLLDLKLAPLFQHFQKHYSSGGAQADPPANPEPHTSDAVVASSPFLQSNTATPDLPQTLADHGSSKLTTSSSIDATHITAAPAFPAQQPIAPSHFAASSTLAARPKSSCFHLLPVSTPAVAPLVAVALTAPPAFQIVAQFREYVFAIHFCLHTCLSVVPLDTLLLCTSPPIYKHEFEPPPVKAISCLQPCGQGYFDNGSIDRD